MTLSKLPSRPAYTLIELMVVIGLIVLLATLTVAVANSSLVDSYKIVGGADRISGWLLTAKQRALRDKTPVGVRLIRDPENPNFIRQAQLVEMPTLYAPNQDSNLNNLPPGAPFVAIHYTTVNLPTGLPAPRDRTDALIQEATAAEAGVYLYWPNNVSPYPQFRPQTPTDPTGPDLLPGDLLRIGELNSTHRITAINAVTTPTWFVTPLPAGQWYKLTLTISNVQLPTGQQYPPSPPYPANLLPVNPTSVPAAGTPQMYPTGYPPIGGANYFQSNYFGLYRGSRPILGEPLLQLPSNMAVDVTPALDVAPSGLSPGDLLPLSQGIPMNQVGDLEIVFNPNGTVLFSTAGSSGKIILWLRDTRNSTVPPLEVQNYNTTTGDLQVNRKRLMDAGEHVLVSISTKTGAIATYPIFPPDQTQVYYGATDGGTAGPYKYALKSTNTGL